MEDTNYHRDAEKTRRRENEKKIERKDAKDRKRENKIGSTFLLFRFQVFFAPLQRCAFVLLFARYPVFTFSGFLVGSVSSVSLR